MNKYLTLAHWLLVAVVIVSLLIVIQAGLSLLQINKINNFIGNNEISEQVPEHLKAQFAQAYNDAQQDNSAQALARLTSVLTTQDRELQAMAYFNRGNIHLRQAQALMADDISRISLVGLAKQDYRTALLLNSSLWDARFNLELALLMVPEKANERTSDVKKKISSSLTIKAVSFRVDLP